MPVYIPIKVVRELGKQLGLVEVVLLAWDGKLTHVVTWGKSVDDCSQAADLGNSIKEYLGWPKHDDQPSRVRKLQAKIKELEAALASIE